MTEIRHPKPTWEPLALRCECGQEWDDWQPSGVTPSVWIAQIKGLRCPRCGKGGKALFIRFADD